MFKKSFIWVILTLAAFIACGDLIPLQFKSILYGLSLSIKSVIIFLLPIIIFALLFKASSTLASGSTKIIFIILLFICCSNYFSTMLARFVGHHVYNYDLSLILPQAGKDLQPYFELKLFKLIPNDIAMFLGIFLGILCGKFKKDLAIIVSHKLEILANMILKLLVYFIPLFILGFILKLQYDGVIKIIIKDYALIFAIIAIAQFTYIAFIYFIASNYNASKWVIAVKNMLPAGIIGFSTMSSAASMPLTLIGTKKNSKNPDLTNSIIPATVNTHLIGDCFAIPIFAFAVLKNYGMLEPSFAIYTIFALYFVIAKFSVAAIPGGGIIVMLPILETYLGFNGEMMSLITALYILFDPVITSANVMGNGGFAMLISKLLNTKENN